MRAFLEVFEREWRTLFADRTIRLIMVVVPIVYVTLFGLLYSQGKVTEVPIALVDQDRTALSRELGRALEQDQALRVVGWTASEQEALGWMDGGRVHGVVVIPPRLSDDVKAGREAAVLTLVDGSNLLIANTLLRAAQTDVKTVSAGVTLRKLSARGAWGHEGASLVTGLDHRNRVLYNPTFSYLDFMAAGLGAAVLQQTLFLGVALAVTREKERGTWAETLASTPLGALVAGKLAPYLVVGATMSALSFGLLLGAFGVPAHGPLLPLLAVGVAFNLAVAALGLAISSAFSSQLQATQVAMLVAVPSFMLSGFTWPLFAMPGALAAIAHALPLTYLLHALREVVSKGRGWSAVATDLGALALIAGLALVAAGLLMRAGKGRVELTRAAAPASHGIGD